MEALVNAVEHGNRGNPDRRVSMRLEVDRTAFLCHIGDEGAGFDPAAVPVPTTQENLLRDHGRGVFLMRHYMNEVAYSARGNEVTLRLKARGDGH